MSKELSSNVTIFLEILNLKGRDFASNLMDVWCDEAEFVELLKNGFHFKKNKEKETDFSFEEIIKAIGIYDDSIHKADEVFQKARNEFEPWYRNSEFYKNKSFPNWQDFRFYNGRYISDLTQIIFLAFLENASEEALALLKEQKS